MPKKQKLSAFDQAIKDLDAYTASIADKQAEVRRAARMKVLRDREDIRSGRVNPIMEIIKNMSGMKDGGEAVPAKFKGFSKLPEKVQQKMDPELAEKFDDGGEVTKGQCRGMGAAIKGGGFRVT